MFASPGELPPVGRRSQASVLVPFHSIFNRRESDPARLPSHTVLLCSRGPFLASFKLLLLSHSLGPERCPQPQPWLFGPAGQPKRFREELCCGRSNLREHRDRGKGEAKASPWLQARTADVSPLRDPLVKSCHEGFMCHLCKSCFSSRVGIDIRRSPLHKSLLEAKH